MTDDDPRSAPPSYAWWIWPVVFIGLVAAVAGVVFA